MRFSINIFYLLLLLHTHAQHKHQSNINVSIFPLCFSLSEMVRQNSYSKIVICLYVLTTCHCSPPEKRDGICLYVLTTCHFDFDQNFFCFSKLCCTNRLMFLCRYFLYLFSPKLNCRICLLYCLFFLSYFLQVKSSDEVCLNFHDHKSVSTLICKTIISHLGRNLQNNK